MDAVVTSSPFAAQQIEACYGRPATVITLGIDRQRLNAEHPERPSRDRLLTVNYLHPRKRVDLIIEAAYELEATLAAAGHPGNPPSLVVVGDGPERDRLRALAVKLGIDDRVEFAGFVADDDLPRYYWETTCYVHATREESFGLSVIEASYCACPVVAVDEGGVRDTVEEGVTGYRVAATPAALAEGVAKVLRVPDAGAALGAAGRTKISSAYRWSRGAEDLLGAASAVEVAWADGRKGG